MKSIQSGMISQTKRFAVFGIIFVGVLSGLTGAQAKDLAPFKAVCHVEFVGPLPLIAEGMGVATHLGAFTSTVSVDTDIPEGTYLLVMTAANGSQLIGVVYPNLPFGNHVVVIDGTGLFAGATGYWDSTIIEFGPNGFTEEAVGQISSVGANKKSIK